MYCRARLLCRPEAPWLSTRAPITSASTTTRRTAVTTKIEARNRARLIAAHADYIGLPVKRILDAGCGTGMLRSTLLTQLKGATYTGMETSEYLCERYGWDHGLIQDYKSKKPFDLVVCYDVVQYLDLRHGPARARQSRAPVSRNAVFHGTDEEGLGRELASRVVPTLRRSAAAPQSGTGVSWRGVFVDLGSGFWLRRGVPLTVGTWESGS